MGKVLTWTFWFAGVGGTGLCHAKRLYANAGNRLRMKQSLQSITWKEKAWKTYKQ